eukprot:6197525-Pleurochrysis_carterae.AAC.2
MLGGVDLGLREKSGAFGTREERRVHVWPREVFGQRKGKATRQRALQPRGEIAAQLRAQTRERNRSQAPASQDLRKISAIFRGLKEVRSIVRTGWARQHKKVRMSGTFAGDRANTDISESCSVVGAQQSGMRDGVASRSDIRVD